MKVTRWVLLGFTGTTLASSLREDYVAYAFIRSFRQNDYTLGYEQSIVPLVAGQSFSLTRENTALGNPVQYGFALVGRIAPGDRLDIPALPRWPARRAVARHGKD